MKRSKKIVWMAGLFLAGGILYAGAGTIKAETAAEDRIAEGVYIGSVDVGGMTTAEAEDALDSYVAEIMDMTFTLTGYNGSIEVTAEEMGVYVDTQDAAERALAVAHTGNLITRYKQTKDLESSNVVIDMNFQIDKQATAMLIYNESSVLNIEAIDNGLTRENGEFVIVPGQVGYEVDIVSSVNEISAYLANEWDGVENEIALITAEVDPKGTDEELALVSDLLGTFSTDFSTSSAGRKQNVTNGCSKIDGTVIYPGDEFSVYATVSPFTQDNGYELAGAYLNGATIESFGGGICQVSTTLYNAAIRAELDITMRYNHSMLVSYVPPSDDAAIAGTYKDMRFINNTDAPIYLEGICSNGTITFNIYGHETRDSNRTVSFESEVISQADPTIQFNLDGAQALGYWHVEQSAHLGTVSRLWKIVKVDGVEVSREVFNNSTYQASPKIVTIGTAGATAEQLASLNAAIATNDEATVKSVVNALASGAAQVEVVPPADNTDNTENSGEAAVESSTPQEAVNSDETAAGEAANPTDTAGETPAE